MSPATIHEAVDTTRRFLATPTGRRMLRATQGEKGASYKQALSYIVNRATKITRYETITKIVDEITEFDFGTATPRPAIQGGYKEFTR